MGVTWWCIFDWYSHQHSSGFQSMGLYTMDRSTPKLVRNALKSGYETFYNLGGMAVTVIDDEEKILPEYFELEQNYPNPFNPSTVIKYKLAAADHVQIKVFNILGKEVTTLINKEQPAGEYKINFNAAEYGLSSGIYIYKLISNENTNAKKMIYLK
jgi:hypothetical protein